MNFLRLYAGVEIFFSPGPRLRHRLRPKLHILVCIPHDPGGPAALIPDRGGLTMDDRNEHPPLFPAPGGDVDDLIFRTDPEWYASER